LTVKKELFGKLSDGREIHLYTLTNKNGMRLLITNFGGRMVQLWAPGRNGRFADVITGFDRLEQYVNRNPFFGALVGRYANRIANSAFTLNGKKYSLVPSQQPDLVHHLHGGIANFSYQPWEAQPMEEDDGGKLRLTLSSPDGDQGYPGKCDVEVIYTLTKDNDVSLKYFAKTSADTVVNLTNHVYFNLGGHESGNILGHKIRIDADFFLPTDPAGIPLGDSAKVDGTPFDLRSMTEIKTRYSDSHVQMAQQSGFDINYYLNGGKGLRKVCETEEPVSGRKMEVWTTKPCMQFYTANKLTAGAFTGKNGFVYDQYCGFCLETQYAPDSPNRANYTEVILRPGQEYRHETVYKFR